MTIHLLNNCNNLDHVKLYRNAKAMYDLYTQGPADAQARAIKPTDACFVLSRDADRFLINRLIYTGERVASSGECDCWVLHGEFVSGVVLSKDEAIEHPVYGGFFNRLGHLKQQSCIKVASSYKEKDSRNEL